MNRSTFTYAVINWNKVDVLCLEDKNVGMSLTNNMENVIDGLKKQFKGNGTKFPTKILYRDSEGNWDGWNQGKETFILIGSKSRAKALDAILVDASL